MNVGLQPRYVTALPMLLTYSISHYCVNYQHFCMSSFSSSTHSAGIFSLIPRCLALASTLSHKPCTQDSLQTSDLREELPAANRPIFDDHCNSSFYAFLAVYPTNKDLSNTEF